MSSPRIRYLAVALAALTAVLTITGLVALKLLPQIARQIVIADLQERFNSTIEIGQIQVDGFIPPSITASGIVLRYQGRNDVPPLMIVERLTASASLLGVWTRRWRVNSLHLEGLQLHIPPQTDDTSQPYLVRQPHPKLRLPPIEFNDIAADDALLEILPRQRDHKPRSFWIRHILCGRSNQDSRHASARN